MRSLLGIKDVINRFANRHIDMIFLIDMMHAAGGIIAFGDHVHFQLSRFYGITFTDHITERAVTAKLGIGRYQ
ncbi:hypothetical protein D9M68_824950 [compost metagenome]